MKGSALLLVAILAVGTLGWAAPQSGMSSQASMTKDASGSIGPSAVWSVPADFINKAHTVCDRVANPAGVGECFIRQMSASGASADAVSFTRMLYQQNGGLVGIMTAYQQYGPVDAAQVLYPLRANDNYALMLVNGDPKILDVDDLQKLDRAAMEQNGLFQGAKKKYPQADVWPGDRSGSAPWPRVQPLPDGGTQFIVTYPLLNGCHACASAGLARFGWNFDASGKFTGTVFIPTPPPPKLTRPHPGQPAQPAQAPPQH